MERVELETEYKQLLIEYDQLEDRLEELTEHPLPGTPHDEPGNCPTWYDYCHCTVETLQWNIERAEKAESVLQQWHDWERAWVFGPDEGVPYPGSPGVVDPVQTVHALEVENEQLRGMLKSIEWVRDPSYPDWHFCPSCDATSDCMLSLKHAGSCKLHTALEALGD